ncbi:MAG: hypothetical protein E7647_08245 [Ruminococcaceae bacterium]|nr:hypothetical protein [Oscillospiraceae bacterium]
MDTEYLKKVGIFVLCTLLCVGLVFYFGYHIWHSFTKEIETEAATRQTYQETIKTEGYIFRTESPIEGSASAQSVVPTVSEGEHIRKGGAVAKMYSDFSPDTVAKIAQIEKQIELLSRYSDTENVSLKDTQGIDAEIGSILSDIRGLCDTGSAGDAVELRQSLVSAVGERTVLTGGYSDPGNEIKELEAEKSTLIQSLGSMLGTVHTPVSGYYYSETDGYEEVFSAELLSDIGISELRELLKSEPAKKSGGGKTVTESRWYLVCMIDESEKNTYKQGSECTVKFKNTELVLEMDVDTVLYDKEGTALILSTNVMPEDFDYLRTQDVEIVKKEYSGLRVPASAVRMVNGETGVYILDVSTVSFRKVEILYTADNSYIVKLPETPSVGGEEGTDDENEKPKETPSLRLHDIIIVEGKGLYEGRIIGD